MNSYHWPNKSLTESSEIIQRTFPIGCKVSKKNYIKSSEESGIKPWASPLNLPICSRVSRDKMHLDMVEGPWEVDFRLFRLTSSKCSKHTLRTRTILFAKCARSSEFNLAKLTRNIQSLKRTSMECMISWLWSKSSRWEHLSSRRTSSLITIWNQRSKMMKMNLRVLIKTLMKSTWLTS